MMDTQKKYHSESSLVNDHKFQSYVPSKLISAFSAPSLVTKLHPLLDDQDENKPTSYSDILLAAETLENILIEGTLIGASLKSRMASTKEYGKMNNRVLKLVYGTMKCNIKWFSNHFSFALH